MSNESIILSQQLSRKLKSSNCKGLATRHATSDISRDLRSNNSEYLFLRQCVKLSAVDRTRKALEGRNLIAHTQQSFLLKTPVTRSLQLIQRITMAPKTQPKALFFDVFGTCVDWRKTVTETLYSAAKIALSSPTSSISSRIRITATDLVCVVLTSLTTSLD